MPEETEDKLPDNGAYTGSGKHVPPVSGTQGGPGGAVEQGTDNPEGSKMQAGEPSQAGQQNPDAPKEQEQQPEQ